MQSFQPPSPSDSKNDLWASPIDLYHMIVFVTCSKDLFESSTPMQWRTTRIWEVTLMPGEFHSHVLASYSPMTRTSSWFMNGFDTQRHDTATWVRYKFWVSSKATSSNQTLNFVRKSDGWARPDFTRVLMFQFFTRIGVVSIHFLQSSSTQSLWRWVLCIP